MQKYVVALDQGTTSSRAVVFDKQGNNIAQHSIEFPQHYPQPGWVEHDPFDILQTQRDALRFAIQKAGIGPKQIESIGITNQRETAIIWERSTGKPIHNAIVWQCRRTASLCQQLMDQGLEPMLRARTGLRLDPYFSATKIIWLLDNIPGARARAEAGELCFGTIDSWLLYNLTGQRVHATDPTNASRTLLYNIQEMCWDEEILKALDIPRALLPEVHPNTFQYGTLAGDILGPEATTVPVTAMAGDQHAALFGQACFQPGMIKATYGTGCFVLSNTGNVPYMNAKHLLTTVAWQMDGETEYALEGSVFIAGALVQWLRDELKIIETAAETQALAMSVEDSAGVVIVPAFTGLGAPYWDMQARGTIVGLTRGAGRAQIARAALEAIAYQTMEVTQLAAEQSQLPLVAMRADGGAAANLFLMQFQADMLGMPVVRPAVTETTALGAAYMAGLATGYWDSRAQIAQLWKADQTFYPVMASEEREQRALQWKRAIRTAREWAKG